MGLNRLQGTPWHIEKFSRAEGDERRHRSRCIHFDKKEKLCEKRNGRCMGSAHCDDYFERSLEEKNKEIEPVKMAKQELHEVADVSEQIAKQLFPIGSHVIHRGGSFGVVTDLEKGSNGIRIVVEFKKGIKKFDLKTVIDNELLTTCD